MTCVFNFYSSLSVLEPSHGSLSTFIFESFIGYAVSDNCETNWKGAKNAVNVRTDEVISHMSLRTAIHQPLLKWTLLLSSWYSNIRPFFQCVAHSTVFLSNNRYADCCNNLNYLHKCTFLHLEVTHNYVGSRKHVGSHCVVR